MAEVNLSASLSKRSRSTDSRGSAGQCSEASDTDSKQAHGKQAVPSYLNQPAKYVRDKFSELEWMERHRRAAGALSQDPTHKWTLDTSPQVKARNRYGDVQAWDNCRVHLKVPAGECDFINASPIVLKDPETDGEYKYIASQGPKRDRLADFWNMIYHEAGEVAVLVMLTQTVESGKEKCAQYFPQDMENPIFEFSSHSATESPTAHFSGSVTLKNTTYDESIRSNVSELELRVGSDTKTVWHFLFAGWSDYGTPEGPDRDALLNLMTATAEKAKSFSNPRIVHCSAGVGRTGTFIALDHLLRQLQSGQLLSADDKSADAIFNTVNRLREQRMLMVYNAFQYQFIYDVLKEQTQIKLGIQSAPIEPRPQKIAKPDDGMFKPELVALSPADINTAAEPDDPESEDNKEAAEDDGKVKDTEENNGNGNGHNDEDDDDDDDDDEDDEDE
ncbi:tyrosine-protein phosphatase 2 [Nannizzia gypsea CBS 118893]|uniref:Tyrosine-protein phosphatase 2 n=1 Tax=Arthroderma gypseum (strain ATCC MYA-4604 / CBS 118893) TaxID=535722 RepID=E5QZB1_ARTGP|nr:tyrosine-protein phosphatase 2 [Nannizzia gypsea CBS 118893]EFQ98129.1 tyrosine-protein phosphatase 2 [Nannizzia gypsea CBS 118893]